MAEEAEKISSRIPEELRFPIQPLEILRKRHSLKRQLMSAGSGSRQACRIAILGGSTTQEIRSILELFLLSEGIQPAFYESEYNAYFEEIMFENPKLKEFKPDVVFVHTSWPNIRVQPKLLSDEKAVEELVRREMDRFEGLWSKIHQEYGSVIVQNNFDMPRLRPLGNLDATEAYGCLAFVQTLNAEFAKYARGHSRFLINDIFYLSAQVGLTNWFDHNYWYNYHMAVSPKGTVAIARNVATVVKAIYGKTKKCLVLDLDNTLWGGVIGDDGMQNLVLGRDHPMGEAYADFQRYAKKLQQRGILLAVCSKNDLENAKEGFRHPDAVLKFEDFSAFKANWNPKDENIREIASELNIGLDSLVFVDDNPAERAIVSAQLPEVAVPNVGSDVTMFAEILEQEGYFETSRIVADDVERSSYYTSNAQRASVEGAFENYEEFLGSLEMKADIGPFTPMYMERVTQLINKTNQFNLTTRRYTSAEVEAIVKDERNITLYGRLTDKFGDNGLVSVMIGSVEEHTAVIDVWLMSCRVLKREMEWAMFDSFVQQCQVRGIQEIKGIYIPSKKNGMVADHYASLGFQKVEGSTGEQTIWRYPIPPDYLPKSRHIDRSSTRTVAVAQS